MKNTIRKKPINTGRVSGDRRVSGYEAGRIKTARAQLKRQPAGPPPWADLSLSLVDRIILFCESLTVTKGLLAGQRLRLLPHQLQFIQMVWGADPRPKIAISSMPRGQGKSTFLSTLVLAALLGPLAEVRGDIVSVATTKDQASIIYEECAAFVMEMPEFSVRCALSSHRRRIEVLSGVGKGSHYRSLAADHGPALGMSTSFFVYDEYGAAADRRLFDALRTGLGKRGNEIGIVISTQAETDLHPFSELINSCAAGNAPGAVLQLIAAPTDSDAFDPEVLKAANPAWGHYLNPTDLLNDLEEAKRSAAFEPAYRRFRLNQRVQSDENARLLDAETWKLGARPIDEAMLRGKPCVAALDDAEKHDLASLSLVFVVDGVHYVLLRIWTPLGQLDRRRPQEQDLFRQWIKSGHLLGVPGPVITTDFVIGEVAKLHRTFNIIEFRHDTARLEEYKFALDKAGLNIPLEKHRQGPFSIGESVSYFTEVAHGGRLIHGNHPLLNYAIANAITVSDSAGNVSIYKGRSHSQSKLRIDPLISTIMAIRPPLREEKRFQLFYIG